MDQTKKQRIAQIRAALAWKHERLHDAQEQSIIVRLENDKCIRELQSEFKRLTKGMKG